jgi:acyl dehydratase
MVGLEFNFRFKKPITVPQTISIEWLVVHIRESTRLGGTIVELRGRIVTEAGDVATGAKGKVLVSERL